MKTLILSLIVLLPALLNAKELHVFGIESGPFDADEYSTFNYSRVTTESPTVWVNRCFDVYSTGSCPNNRIAKGNFPGVKDSNGVEYRAQFTTVLKADGCTRLSSARLYNYSERYYQTLVNRHGLRGWRYRDSVTDEFLHANSQVVTDFRGNTFNLVVDWCFIPENRIYATSAITFDYEVHDRRSEAEVIQLVKWLRQDARDWRHVTLFTNSLHKSGTRTRNGMTPASIEKILASLDRLGVVVWAGASLNQPEVRWSPVYDYEQTLSHIPQPNHAQVMPVISVRGVSLSDVDRIKNLTPGPTVGMWLNSTRWQDAGDFIERIKAGDG